uniref:Uncharacterized protein n=1 Tax=viral metagenome TaxID=1070528 RepID=A0A6M3KZN7_9ZZZZ
MAGMKPRSIDWYGLGASMLSAAADHLRTMAADPADRWDLPKPDDRRDGLAVVVSICPDCGTETSCLERSICPWCGSTSDPVIRPVGEA